jgi:hypothetical protein
MQNPTVDQALRKIGLLTLMQDNLLEELARKDQELANLRTEEAEGEEGSPT